jgi:hypothetical protein
MIHPPGEIDFKHISNMALNSMLFLLQLCYSKCGSTSSGSLEAFKKYKYFRLTPSLLNQNLPF